jgi:hypothetical protein
LEKKTIIDEMFREAHVYIGEAVDMKIETLNDCDKIPNNSSCDCVLDEIYCRSEKAESNIAFDLIVLKCPQCNVMYAYWLDESSRGAFSEPIEYKETRMHTHTLGKSKAHIIPKKCVAEYSKSISAQDNRNRELNHLIQTKLTALYASGLSLATINFARGKSSEYLKNHDLSPKATAKLLAAAIYAKANSTTTNGGLWKHKGEGITERQLKEIFGASRKTIRKWAKLLT